MKTYLIPFVNREARTKAKTSGLKWHPNVNRWIGKEVVELGQYEKELIPHEIYHAGAHDEIGRDCANFTKFLTQIRIALDKGINTAPAIKRFYEVFQNSPIYFSLLNCYELYMAFYIATDGDTTGFWEKGAEEIETIIDQRMTA